MTTGEEASTTTGRTTCRVRYYNPLVALVMRGRAPSARTRTAVLAYIEAGDTVLDVGCGTGYLARIAASLVGPGGRVCAIDAAPQLIAVARRKAARQGAAVDFRVAAVEALPFADATFDVVLSSRLLHHLPDDVKRRSLAEILRVLRPGGRVLIVDILRPTSHFSRAVLTLLGHGGLQIGGQALPSFLVQVGFVAIAERSVDHMLLGFVHAVAPATGATARAGEAIPGPTAAPGAQPHGHTLLNRAIPRILCSPFHRPLSGTLLLITFAGRKSGKRYTIPVTYLEYADRLLVFSNQRWWRNLGAAAPVTLRLRGREVHAIARPVADPVAVAREVAVFLSRKGQRAAPMINVRLDPRERSLTQAIVAATREHVVIYITIAGPDNDRVRGSGGDAAW